MSAEQVGAVVLAGAAHGLDVTARSGGHSYVAGGLGGKNGSLVVDLGSFKTIEVDKARTVLNYTAGILFYLDFYCTRVAVLQEAEFRGLRWLFVTVSLY